MSEPNDSVICQCGEHQPMDLFKEEGVWILLCHTCERTDYDVSKETLIKRWNESKDQLSQPTQLDTEILDGVERWARNLNGRVHQVIGRSLSEEERLNIVSHFASYLDTISDKCDPVC